MRVRGCHFFWRGGGLRKMLAVWRRVWDDGGMEIAKFVLLVLLGLFFVFVFFEAMSGSMTEKRSGRANSVLCLLACHVSVVTCCTTVGVLRGEDDAPPIVGDVLTDVLLLYLLPWAIVHILEMRGHARDLEKDKRIAQEGWDGCLPFGLFWFAFAAVMAVAIPLFCIFR